MISTMNSKLKSHLGEARRSLPFAADRLEVARQPGNAGDRGTPLTRACVGMADATGAVSCVRSTLGYANSDRAESALRNRSRHPFA